MTAVAFASVIVFGLSRPVVAQPAWAENAQAAYPVAVLADKPVAYWRFDGDFASETRAGQLIGQAVGGVSLGEGPRPARYPAFGTANTAMHLSGKAFVRVGDPGRESLLDFGPGDAITLEAWVRLDDLPNGRHGYILGKGRTNNPGFPQGNQNYALRLTGEGGTARVSFLFRSAAQEGNGKQDYHRWTSDIGFIPGSGWHHVAVSYVFGQGDSLKGYLDGQSVSGRWDMGGRTDAAPVVDNDELWIGSSMGGQAGSTLHGAIDELAIYRQELPAERMARRFRELVPEFAAPDRPLPDDAVLVEIFEGVPNTKSLDFPPRPATESYTTPALALVEVPQKYDSWALRKDRTNPFIIHATARVVLPAGENRLLVRAMNGARLSVDGKPVVQMPFPSFRTDGHNPLEQYDIVTADGLRPLQTGDREQAATIVGDGRPHVLRLELFVGGQRRRPEIGETSVSLENVDGQFIVLAPDPTEQFPLTDADWNDFTKRNAKNLAALNAARRRTAGPAETAYWNHRHELARTKLLAVPAVEVPVVDGPAVHNDIDRFINAKLQQSAPGQMPAEKIDDWAFVRRVTLDVIGTIPTPEQVAIFFADNSANRRERYIERLLEHPGWADHWVGYWQDVLAENPSLVKPTLNNSGPFRWWIHETFTDNKPFDRFATELIRMGGSQYGGGPNGFAMASQNDAPMAAKAHIIGQAFLGLEMKCARCHDAPFHDFDQQDLFSVAAMLKRGPQPVPKTSSIPLDPDALSSMIVEVTLKPGTKVQPEWPFGELVPAGAAESIVTNSQDTRERLAALVTAPDNDRFAEVIVNRLWQRYIGRGIVEPVDDWHDVEPSHPELLQYLARELVLSGYDLKHVARLILTSHTYQREAFGGRIQEPYLFAAPLRRRMTAEQVVDSLFAACGKDFYAGELCLDPDGARPADTFLNFGRPRRAWEFTSLSNERDRPSLSLPLAQGFTDVLTTFGWRTSRADPLTVRETEPTVLQPGILANGILGRRFTRLSEDSAFTELALAETTPTALIRQIYRRTLTRPPTDAEAAVFVALLEDGFEDRRLEVPPESCRIRRPYNPGVSWSNHLSPEANEAKIELQKEVEAGDPPTPRLRPDWRERLEDTLWTLLNSPEFVFVP